MGGRNYSLDPSEDVFEMRISSLYPPNDNYVTVEGGYQSPKSLENLYIDQYCCSLPFLGGDIPLGHPHDVVNVIAQSLVIHGALNASIQTLRS